MTPTEKESRNKLIDIKNLKINFYTREGVVKALKEVNFEIYNDETLGLVGESGCGKSVTAQSILNIVPAPGKIESGEVLFYRASGEVVDIASLASNSALMKDIRRKDISIIFQEPMTAFSPIHTIGNQIIEAIKLKEVDISQQIARSKTIEMLKKVGIPDAETRVDSYTFELSGGMRQRAMIAMALVSNPDLLIADEPTTAIDVTVQAQILELMKQLQQELGMAIKIITHDLGVVAEISDRVAVMYLGRIVEKGSVDDIFYNPRHPYTKGLIRSIPDLKEKEHKKLWAIKGTVPKPYLKLSGCVFHPRCPEFIGGRCDRQLPEGAYLSPDHTVSCHLYGDKQRGEKDARKYTG